jgi:hypothetical protein
MQAIDNNVVFILSSLRCPEKRPRNADLSEIINIFQLLDAYLPKAPSDAVAADVAFRNRPSRRKRR